MNWSEFYVIASVNKIAHASVMEPIEVVLAGRSAQQKDGPDIQLDPGIYCYPYSIPIPFDIPSSYLTYGLMRGCVALSGRGEIK